MISSLERERGVSLRRHVIERGARGDLLEVSDCNLQGSDGISDVL